MKNAWLTGADVYCVTVFPKPVAHSVSQTRAIHTAGDALPRSVDAAGVNSACIFDSQTSTEEPSMSRCDKAVN